MGYNILVPLRHRHVSPQASAVAQQHACVAFPAVSCGAFLVTTSACSWCLVSVNSVETRWVCAVSEKWGEIAKDGKRSHRRKWFLQKPKHFWIWAEDIYRLLAVYWSSVRPPTGRLWVRSLARSHQRLQKWHPWLPCLDISIWGWILGA